MSKTIDHPRNLKIEDLNWIGVNGLLIFDYHDGNKELIGFSMSDKTKIAGLSELQAESVCINLLKHIHERRCKRQPKPAPVVSAPVAREGGQGG